MLFYVFTPARQNSSAKARYIPLKAEAQGGEWSYYSDGSSEAYGIVKICKDRELPPPEAFNDDGVFVLRLDRYERYSGNQLLCLTRSKTILTSGTVLENLTEVSSKLQDGEMWTRLLGLERQVAT